MAGLVGQARCGKAQGSWQPDASLEFSRATLHTMRITRRHRREDDCFAALHESTKYHCYNGATHPTWLAAAETESARMSTKARMNVIVIASQKGGAGKSTLALHLGTAADIRTVLLDMDPQQTLAKWWGKRPSDQPALAEATIGGLSSKLQLLQAEGYELCIVDTPPAITASITAVIELADLVLIPVRPSPADLWAIGGTIDIARKAEKQFAFILSQATRGATLVTQAMTALSQHGPVAGVVHSRVGFAGVLSDGRTVLEHDPKGLATAEIKEIWNFVKTRIDESTKRSDPSMLKARKHRTPRDSAHG